VEASRMDANLVLLKESGSHKAFSLVRNVTVLGRRDDCDLRIPLPMVSRRHCAISLNKDSLLLRDLGSHGGTFVNDQKVDDQTTVKPGDYIRIGPLIFVCQIDGKPEKIVPPPKKAAPPAPKAKPQPKGQKPVPPTPEDSDEADLSDLDVSGSSINLDESDSDLEDLKNL
jgi:pSer/pThr/pTyr-binding forkhead associated (FHA) protein